MAENQVQMTEEQKQSINKALNDSLWRKMKQEQDEYRAALLKQSPADILRQADLYALREMIVDVMDTYDLNDLRAAALLNCEHPLQEVAMEYRENVIPMDDVIDCLENRANALIGGQKPLEDAAQTQGEKNDEEEEYEAVEILGRPALFTNGRVPKEAIPDGVYRYELRHGDDGEFTSLEEVVGVNHAGTILTKEPFELGRNGYIELENDDAPNFLGYMSTLREFVSQEQAESPCQKM